MRTIHDEKWLLEELKAGNAEVFKHLYNKYSGQMYANVLKMVKDTQVTEEIVQDIFVRIWQKRESIHIDHSFASYIYRVAQNMVIDFYRKLKRDKELYTHFKTIATQDYNYIEDQLCNKDFEIILHKAISLLPPQQKKVYQLCKVEEYTYNEVGDHLGISPFTVKEHLSKAQISIRLFITNKMGTAIGLFFLGIITHCYKQ